MGTFIDAPSGDINLNARQLNATGGAQAINYYHSITVLCGLEFRLELTSFSNITASSEFGINGTVDLEVLNKARKQNSLSVLIAVH